MLWILKPVCSRENGSSSASPTLDSVWDLKMQPVFPGRRHTVQFGKLQVGEKEKVHMHTSFHHCKYIQIQKNKFSCILCVDPRR